MWMLSMSLEGRTGGVSLGGRSRGCEGRGRRFEAAAGADELSVPEAPSKSKEEDAEALCPSWRSH